jgi:hypothetical protein|tara:strand:+ start:1306 stop:1707 length:402 start_codon:yes stop_codon:yes gene_type:complete
MERLNKVNLTYKKTVTYKKTGEVLTKFEPEVIESWLLEEVDTNILNSTFGYTEEDIEDLEMNIDSLFEGYNGVEWEEDEISFENCGFHHDSTTDYFGEGSWDKSIQMWIDKKEIHSLTLQVESLTKKLESSKS